MIARERRPDTRAGRAREGKATRKAVIVTNQVPGRDIGMQKSGHAHYLGTFIQHLRGRSFEIVLIVLRPKVDFIAFCAGALPYRIISPAFADVGGRIVLRSPADAARCLAWILYSGLPRRFQAVGDEVRLRARRGRGFVHDLGRFVSEKEVAFVRSCVEAEQPDLILYDGIFNFCDLPSTADQWVITNEVKYQRALSFEARGIDVRASDLSADVEAAILERVGNVIAIQWDDADDFRRLAPHSRIVVVPAAMDVPARSARAEAITGRCLFVGSGSFHNYDGARWFLETCWEQLRAAVPGATLEIVGTVCYRLRDVPKGVTLCGIVDDLADAYERASLTIVPLQIGSGLKVKLIEALAYGSAVVTTSVGAQGLKGLVPRPFVVADRSEDFAAACVEVLGSEPARARLASAAQECARLFRPDSAFAEFASATRQPGELR